MKQQLKLIILAYAISTSAFNYAFFQSQVSDALQSQVGDAFKKAYASTQQWVNEKLNNLPDIAKGQITSQITNAACSAVTNIPADKVSMSPDAVKKKLCETCGNYLKENNNTEYLSVICPDGILNTDEKAPYEKNENTAQQLFPGKTQILKVGQIEYVPITAITPGQLRYSSLNVQDKVAKAVANKAAEQAGSNGYKLAYNSGTSILNSAVPKEVLPVILSPKGLVLVDGHHDLFSSLKLGAKTVPIKVIDDLSNTGENFWKIAYSKGYVYPYNLAREFTIPQKFDQLQDDQNRYFAAVTARKCLYKPDATGNPFTVDQKGPEYPLWLKRDKDVPFMEFMISDVLNKANFTAYKNEMGNTINQDIIEQAREILQKAVARGKQAKLEESQTVNIRPLQPGESNLSQEDQLYAKISCIDLVDKGVKGSTLKCPQIPQDCK